MQTITPPANARQVARQAAVSAIFSQPLLPASAEALKVFSSQRGGLRSAGQATVTGNTLAFAPTAYPFAPGETVQLTVTRAVASVGGTLAAARVQQFTVATGGPGRGGFVAPVTGSELTAGLGPRSVAAGDVDNDGDLDLAVANAGGSEVSVRLNTGAGTFATVPATAEVNMAGTPYAVVLGDVDNDGDLDLLAATGSTGAVALRLNDGTGGFTYPAKGAQTAVLGVPTSLALGDVDGDGDLDVVTAAGNYRTVSVRLNDGSGFFTPPATYADPDVGSTPNALALGDLDGDGDLDLAVANGGNLVTGVGHTVSLLLNDGAGHFTPPPANATVTVGELPNGLALGDVNGDGSLDLLTANVQGGTVSVRLNNGQGVFRAPATNPDPLLTYSPYAVVLGDVDGDGDLDFVAANEGRGGSQGGTANVRLNDGTGNFTAGSSTDPAVGVSPRALLLADLDGDLDLDLVTANAGPYLNPTSLVSLRFNGSAPLASVAAGTPAVFGLYPNPASRAVTAVGLPAGQLLYLQDALGRRVASAVADHAGRAVLTWPAELERGLYLLRAGAQTRQLLVE